MMRWEETLENDLRWREEELTSLKKLAINNTNNEVTYRALLRACWALLYAHFEGFTKFAWDFLLDEIEKSQTSIQHLTKDYQVLALDKLFKGVRGNMDSESLWNFMHLTLPSEVNKNVIFHSDYRLQTESNLWPNIFDRECARVGIISLELDNSRSRIKTLISRRNEIAHGKNMTIKSLDEYNEYENVVLLVLHDLAIQVIDIIETRNYINTI